MTTGVYAVAMTIRLDLDRLRELLGEQHEYEGLDYKSANDPRAQRDLVELVKDMGAMSAEGGYIVIGADNDGAAVGIDGGTARRDFDEARLRGQVRRYLPDVDLRCAVHDIDGLTLAVIWIGPHPDGFAIFAADGHYQAENGRQIPVFREGEVCIRRGSSSVRVGYRDMVRLRQRFVEQERSRVRREWAADVTAIAAPVVERPRLMWDADETTFMATAEGLVQAADTVPVRLLLARIKPVVSGFIDANDTERLAVVLDRVTGLASLALLLDSDWLLDESIAALSEVYEAGHERWGRPAAAGISAEAVWLEVAARAIGLGGLAIRQRRWGMVKGLASVPGDRERFAEMGRTWLRHALVMATRAGLLQHDVDGKQQPLSILKIAEGHAARLDCLRPDEGQEGELLFNSICQFDAVSCLSMIAFGDRLANVYPSFGQFYARRTAPAIIRVIEDPDVRATVAPLSDQDLADAIRYLGRTARQAFPWNWDGFDSPAIDRFLTEHPAVGSI